MRLTLLLLCEIIFSLLLIFMYSSCEKEEIKSDDASLKELFINGILIDNYNPLSLNYELPLNKGETAPEITAEATHPNAIINIIQASNIPGEAIIKVTAENGISSCAYKVSFLEPILGNDVRLKAVFINGLEFVEFTTEQPDYLVELPEGITELPVITVYANDKNAKINIIQVSKLPGIAKFIVTSQNKTLTKEYTIQFIVKPDADKILTTTVWEAFLLEIPERDYSIETSDQLFFHKDYTFVWLSTKNTIEGVWHLNDEKSKVTITYDDNQELILYDLDISMEKLFFKYELQEENSTNEVLITCRIYTGSCNN